MAQNQCPHCHTPYRPGTRFCPGCGAALAPGAGLPRDAQGALRSGITLEGRYTIVRLLGMGGFGAVYLADDNRLTSRQVAIKETFERTPEAQRQFELEAQLLARLNHPQLVRVTDYFSTPAHELFLVMDYIPGDDLAQRLQRTPGFLPERQVVDWISQVCEVLTYMHTWVDPATGRRTPIIHRDLKPGNIKLQSNGRVMVIDLGIAKVMEPGRHTTRAARAVSEPYSPMEQYGTGTDERSDVYALGVTLYELLTRQVPPTAPDRVHQPVVLPRQHNPGLSQGVERVIMQAIQTDPAQRFRTAAEMRQALLGQPQPQPVPAPQPQPTPAPVPSPTPPFQPTPSPSRGSGLGVLLAGAGGLGVLGVLACVGLVIVGGLFLMFGGTVATATPRPAATAYPTSRPAIPTVATATPRPAATAYPTSRPAIPTVATATPRPAATAYPTSRPAIPTVATATPRPQPTSTPRPQPTVTPRPTYQVGNAFTAAYNTVGGVSRLGYATGNAQSDWCADELFQYGYVFWAGSRDGYIYVVRYNRSGGSNDTRHGTWSRYRDTYQGESLAQYNPPGGWGQPKGGIGKVWIEQLGGPNAAIGWAAELERGFNTQYQRFENGGLMFASDRFGVSVLFSDGSWQRIGGPNL